MFSPETAEDSPSYRSIGEFKTRHGAQRYVEALKLGTPPLI